MYEELIFSGDLLETSHKSIKVIHEKYNPIKKIKIQINEMIKVAENFDYVSYKNLLKTLVPEYKSIK